MASPEAGMVQVTVVAEDENGVLYRWTRLTPASSPLRVLTRQWAKEHLVPEEAVGYAAHTAKRGAQEDLDVGKSSQHYGWSSGEEVNICAFPLDEGLAEARRAASHAAPPRKRGRRAKAEPGAAAGGGASGTVGASAAAPAPAKVEVEAKAKAEVEAKSTSEAEVKVKAEAEVKAKADAQAKAEVEAQSSEADALAEKAEAEEAVAKGSGAAAAGEEAALSKRQLAKEAYSAGDRYTQFSGEPPPSGDDPIEYSQQNPKKIGSQGHERYEKYKKARTPNEALSLGSAKGDLLHDWKKGFYKRAA